VGKKEIKREGLEKYENKYGEENERKRGKR
jgi:hypothetical protein